MGLTEAILLTIFTAATPLLIAALGELVCERSGVLNLGLEGMMIMGAISGFAFAQWTGNPYIGAVAAIIVGALFSMLFAVLTITLVTNQVATGLALTILGLGISGLWGEAFIGVAGIKMQPIVIPYLSQLPLVGKLLFSQDIIFYASIALLAGVIWFLFRSRTGLILRAVGDNHDSAMRWVFRLSKPGIWRWRLAVHVPGLPALICRWFIRHNGLRTCRRAGDGLPWPWWYLHPGGR